MSDYLTVEEVAKALRLSVKSIYRLAGTDPTFPATRVGGSIRVHRARLERWLVLRTQGRSTRRRVPA
jgi:excisionase family DNA binding protein